MFTHTTKRYFEGTLYMAGFILIGLGVLLVTSPLWYVGVVMACLGLLIVTAKRQVTVDVENKVIMEFTQWLFFKSEQTATAFEELIAIKIRPIKYTQAMYSRFQYGPATASGFLHTVYLKSERPNMFFLFESKSKQRAASISRMWSEVLSLPIIDETST